MRLIDAGELFKELSEKGREFYEQELFDSAYGISCAKTIAFVSPTIDAEPVRHGHWVDGFDADGVLIDYDCSVCNMANDEKTDYCPNCGAKMDEN